MPSLSRISHVVYDLDGLLLNTESFYTRASQSIAQRYGKVFDWSLKSRMIGKWAIDSAKIFTETLELPLTPEAYLEERRVLLEAMFPNAEPMPGAVRLTRHLHRHGIPQAVATSSDRRCFELKISRHTQWFSIFDCFVTGDEPQVKQGKPAPDIFLLAASRLQAAPSRCLAFEDSPAGLQAALAAGMSVVVVPDPQMAPGAFQGAGQVLRNLNQFDPAAWGLPPYPESEQADARNEQKE
jgi:pseudouridine-5'-monophosphatase